MAELNHEPLTCGEIPAEDRPSLGTALLPVVCMVLFLGVGAGVFGMDPHMPLVWSLVVTGLVAKFLIGKSWEEMYEGIVNGLVMGMQAILILLIIYMLVATWISAGTIPGLIYYGLSILTPAVFLPATALLSLLVAFTVGSSWTTAGTLGVAFIGIGIGLGMPEPMTAGAILTGAYAGDKVSPLSDTTNLAAAVTSTDLYDHISAMRTGTTLAFAIAIVGYGILGLNAAGTIPADQIATIREGILASYSVSPLVFLPLVIMFGLSIYGVPAVPALLAGVFAGVGTATLIQGVPLIEAWNIAQSGTNPSTGVEVVNGLLAADGLLGSIWTVSIVVAALALGGLLDHSGVLAVLAHHLSRAIQGVASLTVGTGGSAILMNALTADQYMSIVGPSITFRPLYDEYDLESRNLSRAVEAAGTTTSALIPWNSGGVYMTAVLGVPTLSYAPYYFFGFLSPLILFIMGITGWKITHRDPDTTEPAGEATPVDD